jgi:hypothetical protein
MNTCSTCSLVLLEDGQFQPKVGALLSLDKAYVRVCRHRKSGAPCLNTSVVPSQVDIEKNNYGSVATELNYQAMIKELVAEGVIPPPLAEPEDSKEKL